MKKTARSTRPEPFARKFEGAEALDPLLALTGSPFTTPKVAEIMKEALAQNLSSERVIPTLFDGEPRFAEPAVARLLFQNLLGLWDAVAQGKDIAASTARSKPSRPQKPVKIPAPAPWGLEGPHREWVKGVAAFLENPKSRERFVHSFENRQDALLGHLDEQPLSDDGYRVLRSLLTDLHAMLELGRGEAPRTVDPVQLARREEPLPELAPLQDYADEAVLKAGQHTLGPLSSKEAEDVRAMARRTLQALW